MPCDTLTCAKICDAAHRLNRHSVLNDLYQSLLAVSY